MAGNIMTLTDKQERFAQAIADGMNQSDAYRSAYGGGAMKPAVINVKASQLMANGKVRVRVESLRAAIAEKHLWTREDSVRALRAVADKEEARGSEIVAAIKELNSMHGFNAPVKMDIAASISVIERRIVKA